MTRPELIQGLLNYMIATSLSSAIRPDGADTIRQRAISSALKRPGTLAYEAARKGLLFGTAALARDLAPRGSTFDGPYRSLVFRECSSLFVAYGMSPDYSRRRNDGFDFGLVDPLITEALENDLAFAGGHLVWHQAVPKWVQETISGRDAALAEMLLEVTTIAKHFVGKLDYLTVANEVVEPAYRLPNGLRKSFWLDQIGPDYVAQAFTAARTADPDVPLVLNENNLESNDPASLRKREAVLSLLHTLRAEKIPIDALGLQAHLSGEKRIVQSSLHDFITNVRALGLKIIVTELDVFDIKLPFDIASRDASVASVTADFLDVVLPRPGVLAVNVWGLSDAHSWYNSPHTPAALRRSDGEISRSALFDEDLNKKPVYLAVQTALRNSGA